MSTQMIPFEQLADMAAAMAGSNLFGVKTPQQALALMLVAQAQGIPAATACVDFDIIQGKPSMTARAMLARFQQAGGVIKWLEYSDAACEAEFTHPQCPNPVKVRWAMADAKRAGLDSKDTWKKYPRQMLSSRVMSEGVDRCYPAASGGFYPPEVVQDFEPRKDAPRGERDITPGQPLLPSAPINPTTGALDALNAARQSVVMETAAAIKTAFSESRADDAYGLYSASGFDNEEKIALWSLLPSDIRSALKRMKAAEDSQAAGTITDSDKRRLEKQIKDAGLDRENIKLFCKAQYNKEHFAELTPSELTDLEAALEQMKKEAAQAAA